MKKVLFALFIVIIFAVGLCFKNPLFDCVQGAIKEISEGSETAYAGVNLGFLCENVLKDRISYESDGEVVGECVFTDKSSLKKVASDLGLMVIKRYYIGSREIIEGYSPRVKYSICGEQSNIQICVDGENVQIGSPIIYGSF